MGRIGISGVAAVLALLAGCAAPSPTATRPDPPAGMARPEPTAPLPGERAVLLRVLTYNVEGLPWPVRAGRSAPLRRIGRDLAALRASGRGPDVVLLQEAFSAVARGIAARSGYRHAVRGPRRPGQPGDPPEGGTALGPSAADPAGGDEVAEDAALAAAFRAGARYALGERSAPVLSSGLMVLSDFPILSSAERAFGPNNCAGYDCLSNKGALLVRLALPGVPSAVAVLDTHMNARGASGTPEARSREAHRRQSRILGALVADGRDPAEPLIVAGDFNTRRSPPRLAGLRAALPFALSNEVCARGGAEPPCDVALRWPGRPGEAPWTATQDLQFFSDGAAVRVRPVRVEALFAADGPGGALSDHDGFLVTYRLSWRDPGAATAGAP